jgi:hypothetical protein
VAPGWWLASCLLPSLTLQKNRKGRLEGGLFLSYSLFSEYQIQH